MSIMLSKEQALFSFLAPFPALSDLCADLFAKTKQLLVVWPTGTGMMSAKNWRILLPAHQQFSSF